MAMLLAAGRHSNPHRIQRPGTVPVAHDMKVTVTGLVRPMLMAELGKDFDWFHLEKEREVKLKGRPVIVADSVRTDAGVELIQPAGAQRAVTVEAAPPAPRVTQPAPAGQTTIVTESTTTTKSATLTGCLYRVSDDPSLFVLVVGGAMVGKETATATTSPRIANYKLQGASDLGLAEHVGHKVRVTGTVLPPGSAPAPNVELRRETVDTQELPSGDTIVRDRTTINRYDLTYAPTLDVRSLEHLSETCEVPSR